MLKFSEGACPRHPLKTWTVDTVGYSIQICWLLQFLLKPLNMHVQTSWIKQKPTKKYQTNTGKKMYYFSEDHANTEK